MGRRVQRWPIWKIAVAIAACAAVAVALFWLSVIMGGTSAVEEPEAPDQTALLTLPSFVMILGVAASMLTVLCVVWLVIRIREARTPAWERRGKSRRRR